MPLGLDTRLRTPYGWTTVAELAPESILIDELGYPTRIRQLSSPYVSERLELRAGWGKKASPELGFAVGAGQELITMEFWRFRHMRSAEPKNLDGLTVIPGDWPVWVKPKNPAAKGRGRPPKVVATSKTVEQVREQVWIKAKGSEQLNHHVPATFPLQLSSKRLPLSPYLVGVLNNYWLGGQELSSTLGWWPYFRSAWEAAGFQVQPTMMPKMGNTSASRYEVLGLDVLLKAMEFDGTIPAEYLSSSQADREALLEGLLDRFTWSKWIGGGGGSTLNYKAKSLRHCEQVCDLLRGLGFPAFVSARDYLTGEEAERAGPPAYWVNWRPAVNPYKNPKLRARYGFQTTRAGSDLERYVWKIYGVEPLEPGPVRDISVDSPHGLFAASELMLPVKGDDCG